MNSTESVIPSGNDKTIATGLSVFDLLSGCIVRAMQHGDATLAGLPPDSLSGSGWNRKSKCFSLLKTAVAEAAVKADRREPRQRSERSAEPLRTTGAEATRGHAAPAMPAAPDNLADQGCAACSSAMPLATSPLRLFVSAM
jgi:hypothetical protein